GVGNISAHSCAGLHLFQGQRIFCYTGASVLATWTHEVGSLMATHKILQPGASYSFRSYFNLPNDTDEVLAEFAYSFTRARLQLPRSNRAIERLPELRQQIEETLPYVTLNSEAAKREI